MTAAVMLPSTLLMLPAYVLLDQWREHVVGKLAGFIGAYATAWTIFALFAFLGDTLIHLLVNRWFWLYAHSWLIAPVTLGIAGIYEVSTFKVRCLKMCRNFPGTCLSTMPKEVRSPLRLGAKYGQFCVGSCWAFMLVMFGNGGRSLIWIAALTVIILAEQSMPRYQLLRYAIGSGFLLLTIGLALIYYRSL
jgi:predicted metal-binding membrane protein